MAASKRKQVGQNQFPKGQTVGQTEDPSRYYRENPSWNFNTCDREKWPFTEEGVKDAIWTEILPKLQEWEKQTWAQILVDGKKFNHSIDTAELSKAARDRLAQRYIEEDSLISLRLNGTHRLYGYIVKSVFNILWYDTDHGDNPTCVCRSHKKHT